MHHNALNYDAIDNINRIETAKDVIYNNEGVDPYGRFFMRQEKQGHCGLYAMRNLLESHKITENDLHSAAQRVAHITKDKVCNHADAMGYWSLDAISDCFVHMGFNVEYCTIVNFLNSNCVGYVVHLPEEFHYIAVRRSKRSPGKFEICDSQAGIATVTHNEIRERSVRQRWNFIEISVI